MTDDVRVDDQLLVTPEEAARRLSLGRTTLYQLIASGEIHSVIIGRSRRVPVSELCSYVARLLDDVREHRPPGRQLGPGRQYDRTQRIRRAPVRRNATAGRVAGDEAPALIPLPRVPPEEWRRR